MQVVWESIRAKRNFARGDNGSPGALAVRAIQRYAPVMANEEARICRYCGKLSLVPHLNSGVRENRGWSCINPQCSNTGAVQHLG
jgi:hypothetical protein